MIGLLLGLASTDAFRLTVRPPHHWFRPQTNNDREQTILEGQGLPSNPGWKSDRLNSLSKWAGTKKPNRPVICEYEPSGLWLWFKWQGTVLQLIYRTFLLAVGTGILLDVWVRRVSEASWSILSVPPATDPLIRSLSGLEKLWTYQLTLCTFILTFFTSQSYAYWTKVYNTCRMIQGRINDFCLLVAMSAKREPRPDDEETSGYTPTALKFVQRCFRLIRMSHIFFWAQTPTASNGLTDSEDYLEEAADCPIPIDEESIGPLLLSPFGLKALVNTGQLTKPEAAALMQVGLPPSQYAYILLEWVGLHCMEGMQNGLLVGGAGLESNLLRQLTTLRASMFDIDDFRAGRMSLAYVQLVQILVDSLVILAPFALYPALGSLSIPLVGLLALFFRGLLSLSKSFLDPFGVEGYRQQNIRVDVLVSELNFGASKRWIQAGNYAPIDRTITAPVD